jgi:hypothetical protein
VADLSIRLLDPDLRSRLLRALDPDARIPAALQALGPIADRDVVVLSPEGEPLTAQLLRLGGWIRGIPDPSTGLVGSIPDARADVLVAGWTGFRPGSPDWVDQVAEARRVLRPDGRLLVLHDYGRDEVTGLLGDDLRASELIAWSRPSGPFLGHGFRIRVLHCWWRWDTLEEATELLTEAFGDAGAVVAAGMRRPRLAWKVAVYHLGMEPAATAGVTAMTADAAGDGVRRAGVPALGTVTASV